MRGYLQWHPAFYANMKALFQTEEKYVELESEHNLSSKPMQIDVLIKKKLKKVLGQNIGRLFKRYNIIEYKSPDDYLSIDDYYKTYGYACFYKAATRREDEISMKEVTITFVCRNYPAKLVGYLQSEKNYRIERQEEGIYYICGDEILMQIVVTSQLTEERNFWLKYLTNDLENVEVAERIVEEYKKHPRDELYKSMMNVIVNANRELFKEVKYMCEALRELFKEELEAELKAEIALGVEQAREQCVAQGMAQGEAKERS